MNASVRLAIGIIGLMGSAAAATARAQEGSAAVPTIAQKTAGMTKLDGYFPLYWDEPTGHLWMEIPRFDTEVLFISGLAAGLGSNDIGLDRAQVQDSRIVRFERRGPKILLVEPNYNFRATSAHAVEQRDVADAFARSVLWGWTVAAQSNGHVLVDMNDFLIRDATDMAPSLRPGSYKLDPSRSAVFMPQTKNFPKNTDLEVELTFVRQPAGPRPAIGPGGGSSGWPSFFEGVNDVAASPEAATLRMHHSFVELPGPGYTPRAYDPRSAYNWIEYRDYSAPLSDQMAMVKRFITRHRLKKKDPRAAVSDPWRRSCTTWIPARPSRSARP